MSNNKSKIHAKIKQVFHRYNLFTIFLLCFVVKMLLSGIMGNIISTLFPNQLKNLMINMPIYKAFIVGVLFAPFFETFIFQYLAFYLGKKINLNNWLIVLISSFLFGLSHSSSYAYMLVTFFSGLFYILVYVLLKDKYKTHTAYFFIVGLHAAYNLMVFMNIYFH